MSALADPTRRGILARLCDGRATVSELAGPFDISLPAISRHLKVLERAGLIERERDAQWRPCVLNPEPLRELADWLERYRELWEANFQQLDALLGRLQATSDATAERDPGATGRAVDKQDPQSGTRLS